MKTLTFYTLQQSCQFNCMMVVYVLVSGNKIL